MSIFSVWKEAIKHRKRDKWLVREFPKLALAQFQTLRDLNPSTPREELYETIIKGFGDTFGVSNEKSDEFAKHILHTATRFEPSETVWVADGCCFAYMCDLEFKERTIHFCSNEQCLGDYTRRPITQLSRRRGIGCNKSKSVRFTLTGGRMRGLKDESGLSGSEALTTNNKENKSESCLAHHSQRNRFPRCLFSFLLCE